MSLIATELKKRVLVRFTEVELRRLDRYVRHIPSQIRYSRNTALRELLNEALAVRGFSDDPDVDG